MSDYLPKQPRHPRRSGLPPARRPSWSRASGRRVARRNSDRPAEERITLDVLIPTVRAGEEGVLANEATRPPSEPDDRLGPTIARMRRAQNLSGGRLGELVGMSQAKISRLENGVGFPDPDD